MWGGTWPWVPRSHTPYPLDVTLISSVPERRPACLRFTAGFLPRLPLLFLPVCGNLQHGFSSWESMPPQLQQWVEPPFCLEQLHWGSLPRLNKDLTSQEERPPSQASSLQGDSWLRCLSSRASRRQPSSSCEWCGFPRHGAQQVCWDPADIHEIGKCVRYFPCNYHRQQKRTVHYRIIAHSPPCGICQDKLAMPQGSHLGNSSLSPSLA
jgi:hypothetical protein